MHMRIRLRGAALALLMAPAAPAASAGERSAPADPAAAVPALRTETGLEGYRRFADEPVADWAATVRRAYEAAVELGLPGTYAGPRADAAARDAGKEDHGQHHH